MSARTARVEQDYLRTRAARHVAFLVEQLTEALETARRDVGQYRIAGVLPESLAEDVYGEPGGETAEETRRARR